MFVNEELKEHLETSPVIKLNSAVIAEWNMNIAENILISGNYRYRLNDTETPQYNVISQSFSINDEVNNFYTGATDADVVIDGGVDDQGIPLAFISKKEKERLLYSLEDCFGRFRPRSGINKLRYFENNFSHFSNIEMAKRPRYYMSDKLDLFKYWTSYRTEGGIERGIANIPLNDQNFIQDTAPFVTYKEAIPANRIVVKMQTNVGDLDLGPFVQDNTNVADPFFGEVNKTVPVRWKIQYLETDSTWVDAASFSENSVRNDGSPIVGSDGYLELFYGLSVPEIFRENFNYEKEFSNASILPDPLNMPNGTAYLIRENENDAGTIHVVVNNDLMIAGTYETFPAIYGWSVENEDVSSATGFVKDLTSPPSFINFSSQKREFREFQYIKGLRIVVDTMNVFDSTFDLIEMSPRLTVDITDKVSAFSVTRSASDLGITGLPVGQLLASVGSVTIFDFDQAFFPENRNSIVSSYTSQNIQFKFYEVVKEVQNKTFFIPIKTMYSEGFPEISNKDRTVTMTLRDLFFYFESITAPQILATSASLSYAVSLLLDFVGFSNYTFLRNLGEDEEVIPFFFIAPDQTIASVLNELAVSTQTAMFFDEFNNFVLMSKGYILPTEEERPTNITLRGSKDFEIDGALRNKKTKNELANILDISFVDNQIFNGGSVNYTARSIQRSYGTIRQASLVDSQKTWIYKPVLLWEVTGDENVRPQQDEVSTQSAYALTAIPLNSDLSIDLPVVENHRVVNNTINFGDGVYWTARYDGYFFANGEIIRYDAIQFSIPGLSQIEANSPDADGDNVWISSASEYQTYFSKIPFNGKIFPTGLVRIYAEPHFEVVEGQTRLKNGVVAKHGRGQFGTETISHHATLPEYWSDSSNRRGVYMDFKYLLNQQINRIIYEDVTVESNDGVAVLNVSDATLAKVGDYVFREFDGEDGELAPTTNLIPGKTRISSIDAVNQTITLDRAITDISDQEFDDVDRISSVDIFSNRVNAVLQFDDAEDIENFEVGFYIKNRDDDETENIIPPNTKVVSIDQANNRVTISNVLLFPNLGTTVSIEIGRILLDKIILSEIRPETVNGKSGLDVSVYNNSSVSGVIKNIFANSYVEESSQDSGYPATVQSSALVFKGNIINTTDVPRNYISYIYKPLENRFRHFGTRLRIIGRIENNETRGQIPEGGSTYFTIENAETGQSPVLAGGSGGISIMVNPETNTGYYFELAALTENNLTEYSQDDELNEDTVSNVLFYKIQRDVSASRDSDKAIPIKLFSGIASVTVDDGTFVGQSRLSSDTTPTVYDLAVEYEDFDGVRTFYLYINNVIVGIARDEDPLPVINNMALFVRGNAKVMFENVYALTENYSQNTTFSLDTPVSSAFGNVDINAQSSLQKYAISGLVQATYLSGISSLEPPKYNIYFEEFGTIMREASYFDIRYDKAYPALSAQISPTFNRVKGFTTAGFFASSYGAEFLVFNHTDTVLNLDSTSGNYLKIQGVTFTQQSVNELTVDDYFEKKSNFADPQFVSETLVDSPVDAKKYFTDIKLSRLSQGSKEFSIAATYIQSKDSANSMMDWLVRKIMKPRKSVGISVFGMPILQLGDIVKIDYLSSNGFNEVSDADQRFVVYNIEYTRSLQEVGMNVFLTEVTE